MDTDYQSAQRIAEGWLPALLEEIKKQTNIEPTVHDGSLIETKDDVLKTVEVGGALIHLALKKKNDSHRPLLIVTEKVQRKHRVGIGHSHDYPPMADGRPNFKKAVNNTVTRAKEVDELNHGQVQARGTAADLGALMAEELKQTRIPPELMVNRRADGEYVIHIGSMKVSQAKLKALADVLCRVIE